MRREILGQHEHLAADWFRSLRVFYDTCPPEPLSVGRSQRGVDCSVISSNGVIPLITGFTGGCYQ